VLGTGINRGCRGTCVGVTRRTSVHTLLSIYSNSNRLSIMPRALLIVILHYFYLQPIFNKQLVRIVELLKAVSYTYIQEVM
jgi:hypothetical protein